MFEVNFYLNNPKSKVSTIYVTVYEHGQRYKYPTGISIQTATWNPKKKQCRTKAGDFESDIVNERLSSWKILVTEVLNEANRNLIIHSQETFKEAVQARLNPKNYVDSSPSEDNDVFGSYDLVGFAEYLITQINRSEGTYSHYKSCIKLLREFEAKRRHKKKLQFSDINIAFYEQFHKFMNDKGYTLNYFGATIKDIKFFMSEAADRGLHNESGYKSKKFRIITEDADTIYLSISKLRRFNEANICPETLATFYPGLKEKGLEKRVIKLVDCRDRFMIGAFTALRFSDFNVLEGIKHTDKFIVKRSQKTSAKTIIPMHPIIREILLRRNDILPPPITNYSMLKALNIIGQIAGLNEEVEVMITRGGKKVSEFYPEYELITTHTARRSACTNMSLAGIPMRTIMNFSGHLTVSSFMKYIKTEVLEDAIKMIDHPFFNS